MGYLRVCLDRLDNQVGVDNAWEQEKLEARKMPVNRADSPTRQVHAVLGARIIRDFAMLFNITSFTNENR